MLCDFLLGVGNRNADRHLWFLSVFSVEESDLELGRGDFGDLLVV
jgi:hypothetical protein